MGLFDFLKAKKSPPPPVRDLVWMTPAAKWQGVAQLLTAEPGQRLLAWSSLTVEAWAQFCASQKVDLRPAQRIGSLLPSRLAGEKLLVLEHHLYLSEEAAFFAQARPDRIWVATSLEDPLMELFGSSRIQAMMQQMGASANELIEHRMVAASIRRAQEKMDRERGRQALPATVEAWLKGV